MVHEGHEKIVLFFLSVQFPVVHENTPSGRGQHQKKLVPFIRYHRHHTLFRHTLNRAHPSAFYNKINDPSIQYLDYIHYNFFLHMWIQSALMLNNWFVVWNDLNFVRTNKERDPKKIRNGSSNRSFQPLQ